MDTVSDFDAIIVGTGQAGPALAARLTQAGMHIAVVERHLFGGTCVNTGCTPTKSLVATAAVARHAQRAAEFGVRIDGGIAIDLRAVMARKNSIVAASRSGIERWLREMPGCTVIQGHARFIGDGELQVDRGAVIRAPRIFLNVGGRARIPALPGIDRVPYLTNRSILELDELPSHLAIVGGSYVGLEFAQIFRRFGSEVTVIEKGSRLLEREDEDVSDAISDILRAEGVVIRTHAECIRFDTDPGGVLLGVDCSAGSPRVAASHVLLAMGRRPNTDDLGIEKTTLRLDPHGYVDVDEQLATSVPGVWALGDCNGRGGFTHTAYNDYEIVAANLLDGASRKVTDRIDCYGVFVDPPLGRAGLTEAKARERGIDVRVGRRPMTRVGRAVEKGETQGFIKIIVDGTSGRIVGASILGVGGDEAIHCVLDTMAAGLVYTALEHVMHIHPTVAELIPTVLGELK